ncbi:hypothetical protein [Rossellomorea aquimaris]|uniref:hypothetical protein n=1 Tax=Rossellomorea aquimaris TaxID=189382 RepID=UPI001CFF2D23|nr:hypothetical protein [Rossellomorea aquimaris]
MIRFLYVGDQLSITGDEEVVAKHEGVDLSNVELLVRITAEELVKVFNKIDSSDGETREQYEKTYLALKQKFIEAFGQA